MGYRGGGQEWEQEKLAWQPNQRHNFHKNTKFEKTNLMKNSTKS